MNINIYSKYKLLIINHSSRLSEENETIYDNIFIKDNFEQEVLDEIQNSMKNFAFAKKVNGLGEELDLIPNPILIYNMPKEG